MALNNLTALLIISQLTEISKNMITRLEKLPAWVARIDKRLTDGASRGMVERDFDMLESTLASICPEVEKCGSMLSIAKRQHEKLDTDRGVWLAFENLVREARKDIETLIEEKKVLERRLDGQCSETEGESDNEMGAG